MAMYEKCITDGQTKDIFGFNVGDKLYVASTEKKKVCKFLTDCIKIHDHNTTVHGYIYGLYGAWGTPTEYSLKWLNKRCIFIKKEDAEKWLEDRLSKKMAIES